MALCCLHERALLPPPHLPPFSKLSCYMYNTCIYYEQLEYITNSQKKEKLYTGIRLHAKNGKRKIYTSRKEKVIYTITIRILRSMFLFVFF